MNLLFELFRGGLIFEVSNLKEAIIAEQAGAVALLLNMSVSPIHPDGNNIILTEIIEKTKIPILASFRPGHFVEAEILANMGVWGVYADSRFESVNTHEDFHELYQQNFPLLVDIDHNIEFSVSSRFIPVIRGETIENIIQQLQNRSINKFEFVTGPIETVADIALLKRLGADTLIIPNSVFTFGDKLEYTKRLVLASFYYDNTEKLAELLCTHEKK